MANAYQLESSADRYLLEEGSGVYLLENQGIDADSGVYTIVGASSVNAYGLLAASGSYTLSGSTAELVHGSNPFITPESGSYTLSGVDASLLVGFKVIPLSGDYTITGQNTVLKITLDPGIGSYSLAGTEATLEVSVTGSALSVESGSYTLSGLGAGTFRHAVLVADSGSYTSTLNNIFPSLYSSTGHYTLNGHATTLHWSGATETSHLLSMMGMGG